MASKIWGYTGGGLHFCFSAAKVENRIQNVAMIYIYIHIIATYIYTYIYIHTHTHISCLNNSREQVLLEMLIVPREINNLFVFHKSSQQPASVPHSEPYSSTLHIHICFMRHFNIIMHFTPRFPTKTLPFVDSS